MKNNPWEIDIYKLVQMDNIRKKMFVDLVVPQNIFFDAKSGKIRISLRTFLKSFSGNPKIREIINWK